MLCRASQLECCVVLRSSKCKHASLHIHGWLLPRYRRDDRGRRRGSNGAAAAHLPVCLPACTIHPTTLIRPAGDRCSLAVLRGPVRPPATDVGPQSGRTAVPADHLVAAIAALSPTTLGPGQRVVKHTVTMVTASVTMVTTDIATIITALQPTGVRSATGDIVAGRIPKAPSHTERIAGMSWWAERGHTHALIAKVLVDKEWGGGRLANPSRDDGGSTYLV